VQNPDQPTRFEGRATNSNVRSVDVPAFRAFLETEGQALLERADEWLSRHEPAGNSMGSSLSAAEVAFED